AHGADRRPRASRVRPDLRRRLLGPGPQRGRGAHHRVRPGHDAGRGQHDPRRGPGGPGAAQPLTAPAVRLVTMRRWTIRKNTTTGRLVIVAPAISDPQSVPRSVVNDASQTMSVWF